MKKNLLICGLISLKLATAATAQTVIDSDWPVNQAIPQADPVGITASQTFSGLLGNPISSVTVDLDITGGYNGTLYAYLVLQNANGNNATEVLLNQIGVTPTDSLGSSGAGLDVTLSDAGTVNGSIHNAPGIPTGLWLPDSANTLNGTFGGLTANGTWTLFISDLDSGGGTSTLQSWGLNVTVVPEPSTNSLMFGMGGLLVAGLLIRRQRRPSQPRK